MGLGRFGRVNTLYLLIAFCFYLMYKNVTVQIPKENPSIHLFKSLFKYFLRLRVMTVFGSHSILKCFVFPQMTAESGPLHPQEQPGRTIPLDDSSNCYHLFEDKKFVVKAFRLFHRIPSFGFCVQEHDRPGRLKTEVLKELGECILGLLPFEKFFFLHDIRVTEKTTIK